MYGAALSESDATPEPLTQAETLEGATMPDGTKYTKPEAEPLHRLAGAPPNRPRHAGDIHPKQRGTTLIL